jgi:ammonium transporter, Amt family
MSAGFAALAAAVVLGRRKAHLAKEHMPPANIPFVLLGTGLLWFGWFGFNAGSALAANESAALAFLTTNTASAAAMLSWLCMDNIRGKHPSALGACIGAVVGLVAITPAAGFVSVGSSILIGVLASAVCNSACALKARTSLDDTLDVFPCHGVGGIFGMLATGVFAQGAGLLYGDTKTFVSHLLALGIVGIFSFGGSFLLLKITDLILPLRVSDDEEERGLDLSLHGEHVDGNLVAIREDLQRQKGAALSA